MKRMKRMKEMKRMVPMHIPSRMGRHIINRMLQLTDRDTSVLSQVPAGLSGADGVISLSPIHHTSYLIVYSSFSILNSPFSIPKPVS
jgi:hypothetical protein